VSEREENPVERRDKTDNQDKSVGTQAGGRLTPGIFAPGILTGGWAGRLLARLRADRAAKPRLALVERITLAPRQSLALIEAEGRRILVATSAEGGSAFYALDEQMRLKTVGLGRARTGLTSRPASGQASRVSW
jgi:hypothetical protein